MTPPEPSAPRAIDAAALATVLRRLGRRSEAPWLHGEVARRMAERLPLMRLRPRRIIDWWSFLGGAGERLAQAYPEAGITAVEPTLALRAASASASQKPWWTAARWRRQAPAAMLDADLLASGPQAELVWSNMSLHASDDPLRLMRRWHGLIAPGGFVMFSCFGPDTLRELRALYAPLGRAPGIDFVDMHDLGDMLVQAGFADPVMDQETIRLEWADAEALLSELRSLGGNVSPGRPEGLMGRRWRLALLRALESLRGDNGRLALSFEITYGHAFRGLPKAAVKAETRVSVDDLRTLARAPRTAP